MSPCHLVASTRFPDLLTYNGIKAKGDPNRLGYRLALVLDPAFCVYYPLGKTAKHKSRAMMLFAFVVN
jgi:hypothetical protein